MTTQELIDRITGYRWFRDRKMQIDEGEVLVAANTAQDDVLADLHLYDDIGYLATASGQEIYAFNRGTIVGATNVAPNVVNEVGHRYHTGDRVTIYGIVGLTTANATWPVTYIDADHYSLDGSLAGSAYVSGGYSYHCLIGAERLASDLQNASTFAIVARRRYDQLQSVMSQLAAGNPQFVYQLSQKGYGLSLGILGIPDQTILYKFRYYRIPLPHERISATVDPMMDDEKLLFYGTLYFVLDMLKSSGDEVVERKAAMLLNQYTQAKEDKKVQEAKKKFVADINTGLRF